MSYTLNMGIIHRVPLSLHRSGTVPSDKLVAEIRTFASLSYVIMMTHLLYAPVLLSSHTLAPCSFCSLIVDLYMTTGRSTDEGGPLRYTRQLVVHRQRYRADALHTSKCRCCFNEVSTLISGSLNHNSRSIFSQYTTS